MVPGYADSQSDFKTEVCDMTSHLLSWLNMLINFVFADYIGRCT